MTAGKSGFVWYELMTTDVEAAKAFYTELIGWKMQRWDMGTGDYQMYAVGERPVAGLMKLPDEARRRGAPPHWLGYIGVESVDKTRDAAVAAGAKILAPPTDIPGMGRWCMLQDPQGVPFAPYTASDDSPAGADPEIGDFAWHELATSDHRAAWDFYQGLFGWELTQDMDMGSWGNYRLFMAGPHDGGDMFDQQADAQAPPSWLYYVRVDDLDAATKRCVDMKGQVLNGPMEVPGGDRVAQCMDPQGAAFALHWKKEA